MKVAANACPVLLALIGGVAGSNPANAVRVNADGHGQALIYPYYTARSTVVAHAYVTAMSVTNISSRAKALKVRFLEGKAGADVLDVNLFLAAYDVWTAGVVAAGAGAGIFTADNSCTMPKVSASATNPTKFRNTAYIGDPVGDSLDRTYEGYFEVLEMGVIDPASPLGLSVTHTPDPSVPNASRPSCAGLPTTDIVPAGLSKPTGGLVGALSYINVNDGTDFSVGAVALSQWSDKVQWGAAGNAHPNLADASPATSYVLDTGEDSDIAYVSDWSSGRDAVTALFMVNQVRNDFSVEPRIKAATDWVLTMPTKRFYVSAARSDPPFGAGRISGTVAPDYWCEFGSQSECGTASYHDRESQPPGACIISFAGAQVESRFCGASSLQTFSIDNGVATTSHVFQSRATGNIALSSGWINGWFDFPAISISYNLGNPTEVSRLVGPAGATTITNTATGQVRSGATVTYFGLPIVGFGAQSYANGALNIDGATQVLSNYGRSSGHKFTRRIEEAP